MANGFGLIRALSPGIEISSKVLKAEDYESVYAAQDLVAAASKWADELVLQAKMDAERAEEQGYLDGLARAEEESASAVIAAKVRAHQMIQAAEADLVGLVKLSVERVLGDLDADQKIVCLIRKGIASMQNEYRLKVRVAPEMLQNVTESLPELVKGFPHTEILEIASDAKLPPDTYVIEGGPYILKGSASDQLAKLKELFESV